MAAVWVVGVSNASTSASAAANSRFACVALAERPQIIPRRNASAGGDARPHRLIDRQGHVVDQIADQEVSFGADDPAGQVGEVVEPAGQLDGYDLGAEPRQNVERGIVGGENLGRNAVAFRLRHAGEPQPADAALEHRHRIARLVAKGARIERVRTLHDTDKATPRR